jgi:hypothetical protein
MQSRHNTAPSDNTCTTTGSENHRNIGQRSASPLSSDAARPDGDTDDAQEARDPVCAFSSFRSSYEQLHTLSVSQMGHINDAAQSLKKQGKCVAELAPTLTLVLFYSLIFIGVFCSLPLRSKMEAEAVAGVVSIAVAGIEHATLVAVCVVSIIYAAIMRFMYHSVAPHRIPKILGAFLTLWWVISLVLVLSLWQYELFRGLYLILTSVAAILFFVVFVAQDRD